MQDEQKIVCEEAGGYETELDKIQEQLDAEFETFIKKDFDLKLSHHNKIQHTLALRDELIKKNRAGDGSIPMLSRAFENFELMQEFLPVSPSQTYDSSIVSFITAEYLPDYKLRVTLELNKNDFVKDEVLSRTISIFGSESDPVKINWINEEGKCPLLDFFENEEDDIEAFDIIYDFYVNSIAYSKLER